MKGRDFQRWVERNGGELIAPTNPYEQVRFRAGGETHVIYAGKKGRSFSSARAKAIFRAYQAGEDRPLAQRPGRLNQRDRMVQRLLRRDGGLCFFCCRSFTRDDPPTIEHIVAKRHGGPNHISNLALAHDQCNQDADTLGAVEKFARRMQAILSLRDCDGKFFSATSLQKSQIAILIGHQQGNEAHPEGATDDHPPEPRAIQAPPRK